MIIAGLNQQEYYRIIVVKDNYFSYELTITV